MIKKFHIHYFFGSIFRAGGVTLCNALRAFAINKLLAVFLPPAAFACVGQFINLMTVGQATSSLALQNGWTSLTAQNLKNEKQLLGLWRGGLRVTTFATIFTCVAFVLFCFIAPLENLFPGMPARLVQAAILFALPGIVATNVITICSSVFLGMGRQNRWMLINIVASVWQVLWVAFFLYSGRLSVLSVVATQSIVAAMFAALVAARSGFTPKRIWSTAADIRGPWRSYALMGMVPMMLTPVVMTVIRWSVDANFGHDAAGIWQSIWKVSDFIFMMVSAVLTAVLLPKISLVQTKKQFNKLFYTQFFFVAVLAVVVISILFFGRSILVPVLFSKAYLGAVDYMGFQLLGDLFRIGGFALALVLISRRETKKFLTIEILGETFLAIGAVVGMKLQMMEFHAPMIAYAAENILYFVAMLVVVRRLKWNTP